MECSTGADSRRIYKVPYSITAIIFEAFAEEQVLSYCTLYLGPRSVLILDNVSIYKLTRLRELCEEYGVLLKFLPPYSPDFNPIEATFNDIRRELKGTTGLWKTL